MSLHAYPYAFQSVSEAFIDCMRRVVQPGVAAVVAYLILQWCIAMLDGVEPAEVSLFDAIVFIIGFFDAALLIVLLFATLSGLVRHILSLALSVGNVARWLFAK